ncbi:MAG TPA: AAA family ATPase [Pseudonocardiaceae bacterium]
MLERTRLEVQDIANKTARQVFARHNVRILAAEHVRGLIRKEITARFKQLDDDTRAAIAASADAGVRTAVADLDLPARFEQHEAQAAKAVTEAAAEASTAALRMLRSDYTAAIRDEVTEALAERIREEVTVAVAEATTPTIRIEFPQLPPVELTAATHRVLPDVLLALRADCHVFLVGPAGTGKSMLAKQVADAMGLPFQALSLGPTTPMSKVFGYFDAHGNYHDTPFRRAFEHGGIMLLDELDNGHPGLLGELNQALALRTCAFADRMVDAHPDFHLIATGNTYGSGGNRQYVGRQALDAATLDRFVVIDVPVDERLEQRIALANAPGRAEEVLALVQRVRTLRALAEAKQLPVMFSPRASIDGAKLIAAGASVEQVMNWRVVRGLSPAHRTALELDGAETSTKSTKDGK